MKYVQYRFVLPLRQTRSAPFLSCLFVSRRSRARRLPARRHRGRVPRHTPSPRSIPWKFRSKACFQRKNSPKMRHIVAKITFSGLLTAELRTDVFHYQLFLIFAYLRATAQARENIRFSMLKNSRADKVEEARRRRRNCLRRGGIPAAPPKPSGRGEVR